MVQEKPDGMSLRGVCPLLLCVELGMEAVPIAWIDLVTPCVGFSLEDHPSAP